MIAIGALSERSGVHIETIRYFEKVGLMPKPERTRSGRRLYGEGELRRLVFIRHARELGFTPNVVRALLDLQERPNGSCAEVSRLAGEQLDAIDQRIEALQRLRTELDAMIASCAGGTMKQCGIVDALAGHEPSLRAAMANP
ncbi:MAG: helix-turn-helix domain-containing protein [Caulobacter sp.]|nr:helix-turn-helix domain-containing protein [Caulobacter sp.]